MVSRRLNVTLLSDVSITADAATVGGHSGLDYLPGSLFLGAAAAESHRRGHPFDADFFLSGRVRFLDALPLIGEERGFSVPLCFHREKGEPWEDRRPINMIADEARGQPKQWRQGYMNSRGEVMEIQLDSRMKTAIDRRYRRSSEAQLFGYESIPEGTEFQMEVQADSDKELETAFSLLTGGSIRLGRSKSAEYGAVRIEEANASRVEALAAPEEIVYIQLMSDLALLQNGMSVLIPEGDHFGLEGAVLLPEKTFLRSRSYSPWNAFHNCRTTERQVLCKGGVITFKIIGGINTAELQEKLSRGVGLYREEGLGQVWVNPAWLLNPPVLRKFKTARSTAKAEAPSTVLAGYLRDKTEKAAHSWDAFNTGVEWAKQWSKFCETVTRDGGKIPGKSQWGTIRELALQSGENREVLLEKLEEFCTKDLRTRIWNLEIRRGGEMTSIYRQMEKTVKNLKNEKLACLALFHASVEMSRRLPSKDRKEASGR